MRVLIAVALIAVLAAVASASSAEVEPYTGFVVTRSLTSGELARVKFIRPSLRRSSPGSDTVRFAAEVMNDTEWPIVILHYRITLTDPVTGEIVLARLGVWHSKGLGDPDREARIEARSSYGIVSSIVVQTETVGNNIEDFRVDVTPISAKAGNRPPSDWPRVNLAPKLEIIRPALRKGGDSLYSDEFQPYRFTFTCEVLNNSEVELHRVLLVVTLTDPVTKQTVAKRPIIWWSFIANYREKRELTGGLKPGCSSGVRQTLYFYTDGIGDDIERLTLNVEVKGGRE